MKKILLYTLLLISMFAIVSANVQAAAYMKIGDIKGEATDNDHKDWIIIESVSSGIHQPSGRATGATRRRGSVILEDISVVKELDKSSPKIQEAIANGEVIPKVEIHFTRTVGEENVVYYAYELKNVLVTSYSFQGFSEDVPVDEFTLNYEEIKVTYTEQDEKGSLKGIIEWIYSLVKNRRA